jgi:reactive intermediate/imine deaminase
MSEAASVKSVVEVPGLPRPKGVWSNVVSVKPGRMVFISGLLAKDEKGEMVGIGDMAAQTEQICLNLQKAVRSAGGELKDIVRVDVYITDMSQFDAIHEVRRRYFPSNPPASTMVQVSGFTTKGALIEINAIAVLP